ncbi:hypothetical protein BDV59DRAFT_180060 [Aspergillus ambiguus]|uniref:uncharacterized protein n=1 Tax=Aspergillus ambiguus TaxID=176160 RepID=UPI003CCE08D8
MTQRKESLKVYDDRATSSGQTLKRSFCGICGSNLFIQADVLRAAEMVIVTSGTIENKSGLHPDVEFYCQDRRGWLSAIYQAEQKETQ